MKREEKQAAIPSKTCITEPSQKTQQ